MAGKIPVVKNPIVPFDSLKTGIVGKSDFEFTFRVAWSTVWQAVTPATTPVTWSFGTVPLPFPVMSLRGVRLWADLNAVVQVNDGPLDVRLQLSVFDSPVDQQAVLTPQVPTPAGTTNDAPQLLRFSYLPTQANSGDWVYQQCPKYRFTASGFNLGASTTLVTQNLLAVGDVLTVVMDMLFEVTP